jgi:hypothetical protein
MITFPPAVAQSRVTKVCKAVFHGIQQAATSFSVSSDFKDSSGGVALASSYLGTYLVGAAAVIQPALYKI